jgi:hypothetical protein
MLVISLVLYLYVMNAMTNRRKAGQEEPQVRKLPAVEAIDEAIGRCTEMGRPVLYVYEGTLTGTGRVGNVPGAVTSISVQKYVAGLCAMNDTQFITTCRVPEVFPMLVANTVEEYTAAGKLDKLDEDYTLRYVVVQERVSWYYGQAIIMRERPAALITIPLSTGSSMLFPDAASRVGAIVVGGAMELDNSAYHAVTSDYCVFGPENLATGAYLTDDVTYRGALFAGDYMMYFVLAMVTLGVILTNFGNEIIKTIITM